MRSALSIAPRGSCARATVERARTTRAPTRGVTGPFLHSSAMAITKRRRDALRRRTPTPIRFRSSTRERANAEARSPPRAARIRRSTRTARMRRASCRARSRSRADEKTLYVTGERSGKVHAVDVGSASATSSVAVCSEPVGILLSPRRRVALRRLLARQHGRAARRRVAHGEVERPRRTRAMGARVVRRRTLYVIALSHRGRDGDRSEPP